MFQALLNQMIYLFAFIAIGFLLGRIKVVPDNSEKALSKLENYLFVPALVLGTFIEKCTVETLSSAWTLLVLSLGLLVFCIPVGIIWARIIYKDDYMRKVTTYGFAFSNFGFMGNAIILGVFPDIFFQYSVFTLPFWAAIYAWGAPALLIADGKNGERTIRERIKPFVNPMFIAMIIGAITGLTGLGSYIPSPVKAVINTTGDCMSPMAMLLTGLTIAKTDLKKLFTNYKLYIVTAVKLVFFPLVFVFATAFIPRGDIFTQTVFICGLNVSAMPIGMNTIVIPAAYGKDTTDASGMVLISHVLSVITIPLIFMLYTALTA